MNYGHIQNIQYNAIVLIKLKIHKTFMSFKAYGYRTFLGTHCQRALKARPTQVKGTQVKWTIF